MKVKDKAFTVFAKKMLKVTDSFASSPPPIVVVQNVNAAICGDDQALLKLVVLYI